MRKVDDAGWIAMRKTDRNAAGKGAAGRHKLMLDQVTTLLMRASGRKSYAERSPELVLAVHVTRVCARELFPRKEGFLSLTEQTRLAAGDVLSLVARPENLHLFDAIRIEIKSLREFAGLREAAEFGESVATTQRPVAASRTAIEFQDLNLVARLTQLQCSPLGSAGEGNDHWSRA